MWREIRSRWHAAEAVRGGWEFWPPPLEDISFLINFFIKYLMPIRGGVPTRHALTVRTEGRGLAILPLGAWLSWLPPLGRR